VPLYGIVHEERGAAAFNKFLNGQMLFDAEVRWVWLDYNYWIERALNEAVKIDASAIIFFPCQIV